MYVVVAPDSYKGCLEAFEVANIIKKAWTTVFPEATVEAIPMADGGEGTMDALVLASHGRKVQISASGPLMESIVANYGVMGDERTAVIEVAQVAGLPMVPKDRRNPLMTTSYGLGEVILHAINQGFRKLIIGLGGSATNDGGLGMLHSLGAIFLDSEGQRVIPNGTGLKEVRTVDLSMLDARIKDCELIVASDVDNPLCGTNGASFVFGPQKGATEQQVKELDTSLYSYAKLIERETGMQLMNLPGAGAAGGLGFALLLLGARLVSGAHVVAEATGLITKLRQADWVITGEGKSDFQTVCGKLPFHVAKLAKEQSVKAILISGGLGSGYEELYDYFVSCHSISTGPISLEESMQYAEKLLFQSTVNIARLVRASK